MSKLFNKLNGSIWEYILKILSVVLVVILFILIYWSDKQDRAKRAELSTLSKIVAEQDRIKREENEKRQLEEEEKRWLEILKTDKWADESKGTIIETNEQFIDNSIKTGSITTSNIDVVGRNVTMFECISQGNGCSIDYNFFSDIEAEEVILLKFTAKAIEKCGVMTIYIDDFSGTAKKMKYFISTQWTKYYLPLSGIRIKSICFDFSDYEQKIFIGNFSATNFHKNFDITEIKSGMWNLEDFEERYIYLNKGNLDKSRDCISDDKYLYTISSDLMVIYSLENPGEPAYISKLNGIGNARHIALTEDGNAAIITSREHGAYIIDVHDKDNPVILSHYDTLEYATGIDIYGNYAFICSRYYGVEIVDISDLSNPKLCSVAKLPNEEFQDCKVSDGYLYVGVWANKRIEIFDIHNVAKPLHVSTINLDGRGYGVDVKDGKLYAATGHHAAENFNSVDDWGYGQGNGLEIYDISNPSDPKWLSTTKLDGKFYFGNYDIWKVKINNGIAYLSNSFNGIFKFDVSNPSAPKRIGQITTPVFKDSSNYIDYSSETAVFPYDSTAYLSAPITGFEVVDGYIYLSCPITNTFACEDSDVVSELSGTEKVPLINALSNEAVGKLDIGQLYKIDGNIHSVAEKGEYIYVACGKMGIQVLDRNLSLVSTFETEGSVVDLKISGDILYTAEGRNGLGIYRIYGNNVSYINRFNVSGTDAILSIEISQNENYIFAQNGIHKVKILDISDIGEIKQYDEFTCANMYYRALSGNNFGSIVCVQGLKSIICYGYSRREPVKLGEIATTSNEHSGIAIIDNTLLINRKGGYSIFDFENNDNDTLEDSPVYRIGNRSLIGKMVVSNNILVITQAQQGRINIIDISDLKNPALLKSIDVPGSPQLAYMNDDTIYIPLLNEGLMKIKIEDI